MTVRRSVGVAVAAVAAALCLAASSMPAPNAPDPTVALRWQPTPTGSTQRLQGLAAVSRTVAWASGTGGTVLRSTDAGASWSAVGPPDAGALQFRDVEATSDRHAVVLSVGNDADSRIYVTDDGGATWSESFRNRDPLAYFDCLAFSTAQRGLAVSDPVGGVFRFVETTDAGHTWSSVDPAGMPSAHPNEYAFAASGTCLSAGQGPTTYLGSGGTDPARVFTSQNRGHTWSVTEVPISGAPSAGVLSVRFANPRTGIAVGGDAGNPTSAIGTAAWTADGTTWQPADPAPKGYRSAAAWLPGEPQVAVAVGPTGSDVSVDAGRSWTPFDDGGYDSVQCADDGGCWASGEQGRVARLVVDGR